MWLKSTFILLILLALSTSFSLLDKQVDPTEFMAYCKKHATEFSRQGGDGQVHWVMRYIPDELHVIRNYYSGSITQEEAQSWLNEKNNEHTFMLELHIPEMGNIEFLKKDHPELNYEARVKYYAFEFKNHITFQQDEKEKQKVTQLDFERNYGVSSHGTFQLTLPLNSKTKNLTVYIDDNVYAKQQTKLEFDVTFISKIPRLKHVKKWKKQ